MCYYIGNRANISLSKISGTEGQNLGTFHFKIEPAIDALGKMDFKNLLKLNCTTDYAISDISYSSGLLALKIEYAKDMEGVPCSL